MRRQCWIYITTELPEDREATLQRLRQLGEKLRQLCETRPGLGCAATALFKPDDYEEEDIDAEHVEHVSEGRFPVVHLNMTYQLDRIQPGDPEIEAMLAEYGFRLSLTDQQGG